VPFLFDGPLVFFGFFQGRDCSLAFSELGIVMFGQSLGGAAYNELSLSSGFKQRGARESAD
jgi:hypothetical protein